MKFSSIRYLTKEGFKNVWVNRLMTFASIGVLVACMVLIGLALLISFNVDLALGNLEKQNVVMVFFNDKNSAIYADENPVSADKVTDDMYTLKSNMDSAKEVIQNKLKEDSLITIAQVRDIFSTSRKSAKPILEYMDSIRVTKRAGAETERIAY